MVSASNATEPLITTHHDLQQRGQPSRPRLILTARIPWQLASNASSTESAAS